MILYNYNNKGVGNEDALADCPNNGWTATCTNDNSCVEVIC